MLKSPLVVIALILYGLSVTVNAQAPGSGFDLSNYGVRIQPDKRLITVLATLEMAVTRTADGREVKLINAPLTEKGERFRERLLADNAGLNEDLRRRISAFVLAHKRRNPQLSDAELLSPFVSMAYALSPVPELADPVITSDLPGKLLDVLDFAPLVREFYRRSGISGKLDDYAKLYILETDPVLRPTSRAMVSELLDYLHTRPKLTIVDKVTVETRKAKGSPNTTLRKTEVKTSERRFHIVPEMLAPKGNVTLLNIRDDYYVVVPPDTDMRFSEARRAFLQFVLDPIVLANAKEVEPIRNWVRPILEELRRSDASISPDVFLTITRSLVAAVDVRNAIFEQIESATARAREKISTLKTDEEKRAVVAELDRLKASLSDEAALRLWEDYQKGAVLSFFFAEQLKGVEESGFDIANSLREMIASFDPVKETARVAASAEPRERAMASRELRRASADRVSASVIENPVTARLLEIQKLIEARDLNKASAELRKLAAENPGDPRIYYNIGRVAGLIAATLNDNEQLESKLVEAQVAYSNVIRTATPNTDRALLSLTYVALGKIYEHFNDTAYAIRLYDEAIKLDDVAGGAFRDAIAAKQRLIRQQQ
jgi:tetratricopeptide (TPR) repeat protein